MVCLALAGSTGRKLRQRLTRQTGKILNRSRRLIADWSGAMTKAFNPLIASDIFRPTKAVGEVVNVHVLAYVAEPQPDYEAMQRLIAGVTKAAPTEAVRSDDPNREVSPQR
jgi:hypothetical protein